MSKGIKRLVRRALTGVNREIAGISRGGFYAAGLSSEGYAGGYAQALSDVLLALNGVTPNGRYDHLWRPPTENEETT